MKTVKIMVENIKIPYQPERADLDGTAMAEAEKRIRRLTGSPPLSLHIAKKSIDARRRDQIFFVVSVAAEIPFAKDPAVLVERGLKWSEPPTLAIERGTERAAHRHVIVGFGPAGMFAGLLLAKYGLAPVIYERGACVNERIEAVERFFRTGELDTETNVQFGAGGAGTFSDGKLTTRINDPLCALVLQELHDLGAPEEILWQAKPHIGTDILRQVVRNANDRIVSLGGEIHYRARVSGITDRTVRVNGETVPYSSLTLAIGHSARDTYRELMKNGFVVEPKPFSAGVRVEHLQTDVDRMLFGSLAGDKALGRGEYQLSYRRGERGTYTFCMCPGGVVVPSSSETETVVTNGMSNHARDGVNANSALCVSVKPEDYGATPQGAIDFQLDLERRAYQAGGGDSFAPVQTVGDLLEGRCGTSPKRILPTYGDGRIRLCDFHRILPPFITEMLCEGLRSFDRKMKGFAAPDVPLTGVETRTSAPVRIVRTERYHAVGHENLYPAGEGAGYAGGIVSAAVDGLRVGCAILSRFWN